MKLDDTYNNILQELDEETPVPTLYNEEDKQQILYRVRRLEEEGYVRRRDERKHTVAARTEKGDLWLQNNDLEARVEELEQEVDEAWEALEDRITPLLRYIFEKSSNLDFEEFQEEFSE